MKKRWILLLMVSLLIVTMLAVPVMAEGDTDTTTAPPATSAPTDPTTAPTDPTTQPTDPTTKPTDPSDPTTKPAEDPSKPTDDTTKPTEGEGGKCEHNWVAVEVVQEPTCKDEGIMGYICSKCGELGVGAIEKSTKHTYDSPCDPDCNICGAVREAEHKFSLGWDYNSTKHWHPCTICGARKGEADHFPGPLPTEDEDQICLTCGKVMMTKRSHVHDQQDKLAFDETGHWYPCKDCDERIDFEPHNFGDTCGSPCKDCGYTPDDGHAYSEMWCSSEDEHWKACTLCGAESEREAHAFGPDSEVCSVCGFGSDDAEVMLFTEVSEEWFQDSGSHWHEGADGAKAGLAPHTWDEGTPNADGTITYTCTECQFEKTEEAEAAPASVGFPAGPIFAILGLIIVALVIALLAVLGVFKKPKKKGHFSNR